MNLRKSSALGTILFAIAAGSFAGAPSFAAQAASSFQAQVDLLDCDGVPCITATINGQTVKLGIDSGNAESVLDAKVAAALGIKPSEPPRSGAPFGMFRMTFPRVQIGGATLPSGPGLAMDLGPMIEQKQVPHLDGTLAYTAFKDRIVQLDFVAHKLRISEPSGKAQSSSSCDKIELITFGKEGPPIVVAHGFEVNGQRVTAQVDTMFTGSLLIYTASIEKLGVSAESKTEETELFPLTDGGVQMKVSAAKQETFHGSPLSSGAPKLYFPTPDVHEPDDLFDATVGLALFRDAVVTFDFRAMTLCVAKAAS
jgi:hypothetical protein